MSLPKNAITEERVRRTPPSAGRMLWTAALVLFAAVAVLVIIGDSYLKPNTFKWLLFSMTAAGIALLVAAQRLQALAVLRQSAGAPEDEMVKRSLFRDGPFPLALMSPDGRFQDVNDIVCDLLGYRREELMGQSFEPLIEAAARPRIREIFGAALKGAVRDAAMTMLHKKGHPVDIHLTSMPLMKDRKLVGILVASQDVSERKLQTERIRYMAYYDDMTGLPNRRLFMERLTAAMEEAGRSGAFLAILYLDVDRFKLVNESFGRDFGDMLLLQVAERLTRCLERQDMVARMEGDEFALIATGLSSEAGALERARAVQEALVEPFELQGFPFHLSVSIGISTNASASDDAGALLKMADMALGRVKEQGQNDVLIYSEAWNDSSLKRLTLQHELRQALLHGEFQLFYQPQYHLATGRIIGMEALIRWKHPERGMVPPGVFIPAAEESGLIVQIGDWVLEEACRQNRAWQDAGLKTVPVSVNLSIRQFLQQNLPEKVAAVLDSTGLEARFLDLEITESMTMDVGYASSCLLELSRLGVGISMDDFGTGYSSFHYLKNFPINRLKIDQSFVRDIQQDPGDAAIVAAIIAMAHNLNLFVIAEGVETEEQLEFLKKHNCDEMQGYFMSRPVAAASIPDLLRADA